MKNVLVTGGAGFIGSHVARACLELGFDVTVLDDLSGGTRDNLSKESRFVYGSICDKDLVQKLFTENKFSYVYHLAAYAAEGLSHFIRRYNYNTNLIGSINLINESVKHSVECFVFTSSIAVYGAAQTPMNETTVPRPEDPYGISKYSVELDLAAAHEMFGLNYVTFRPHNVYGENQNIADKYRNVIGIFMNQVMRGEGMTIFGDGRQTRAFSHVNDVAPIIAKSPSVRGALNEVFNVGSDQAYSVLELANEVARAFGVMPKISHLPARNEVIHAFASHEKTRAVFGAHPTVSLSEGIKRMAEWAKKRGPMEPVEFSDIEIEKNIPPSWRKSRKGMMPHES